MASRDTSRDYEVEQRLSDSGEGQGSQFAARDVVGIAESPIKEEPQLVENPTPRSNRPKRRRGSGEGGADIKMEEEPTEPREPVQDDLWATHEVSLLAKVTNAILVKDFRPIAVLPVMYKLYSRILYMLGETTCRDLVEPQFALRKFHQAHEVVFSLIQLVEKAVEWRNPHVYVMDGDIKKAYDFTSHKAFAEAARSRGMEEVLVLAWLREWRRMKSIFRPDAETTSGKVTRARSLPQGDPAAPMLFNLILDTIATRFVEFAVRSKLGEAANGCHVGEHHPPRR